MIRAGEMSGTIDDSLDRLADHFEKAHQLRQKVISALSYPLVVGIVRNRSRYLFVDDNRSYVCRHVCEFRRELPWLTRFVMNASNFVIRYWYLFVLFVGLVVVGIWMLRRNGKANSCWIPFF